MNLFSFLPLLFDYFDLALRTFIVVSTTIFCVASLSYPMSSNTDKKKRKSARLAGLEPNPSEMVSRKVRKTNGLLTPHASFKDTEKNPGRSQNKRKDRATVHPPEAEASTGEDDVKKDPETAKHSPIASTVSTANRLAPSMPILTRVPRRNRRRRTIFYLLAAAPQMDPSKEVQSRRP